MASIISATTHNIDKLILLLDAWKLERKLDRPSPDKPHEILSLVERIINADEEIAVEPAIWHDYLDITRRTEFLRTLIAPELRNRWAETTFDVIRASNYTFETMLSQRAREIGHRDFFFTF